MAHSKARLNVNGRRLLVERVRTQGWPVAHAAKAMGLSRQCAHHWLKRYDELGDAGLYDRSSRPHTMPRRTSAATEQRVLAHRRQHRQGPASISAATGVPVRTVTAILRRHDMPSLACLDPITGEVIRSSQKAETCAAFVLRAARYFADHGVERIERVITDNAFVYRHSGAFAAAVAQVGARQKFIKPHCPWQNGKVERFNRTLATEWAYRRAFTSNQERRDALAPWLEFYNTARGHSALGGKPPTARLS